MNIFNKIIVVLILIFLVFVSLISILNVFVGFFKWSDIALKVFNPEFNIPIYISSFALFMAFIIFIFLLVLEFYRRKVKIAKIQNVKSGKAMITLGSVAQQIKDKIVKIDGLQDVGVIIHPKSNGIIIDMKVELSLDVNIPEKMQEIINEAASVASDKLGIKVVDTKLTIINLAPERKEKVEEKESQAVEAESQNISKDEAENTNDNV